MHIDFAPPSNGTYNNSGSSRQLANYMEHEDLERMEKGIFTEGFFNLTDDNIYKSKVIKDIDSNIGQLLKTDAKFFAIHVSPSESELRAMGNTEQEKNEAMKRYIREVFIPEYANNFNKELSASDIKFYGKIHFDRSRSGNELNMHCHLIVSRKDHANKKKLSPLTNHKNTKKGTVTGGFNRVNLFRQAELGFDKLFDYNRQQTESFDYHNMMKNSSTVEQLKLQEKCIQSDKRKIEIIRTLAYFGIVIAILLLGYFQTGTKLNLLTVVAIVGCLPASKALVGVITRFPYRSIDGERAKEIASKTDLLTVCYDMVITSRDHIMPVDCIVISGHNIFGYTHYNKVNTTELADHIKTILAQNGYKGFQIRILNEYKPFITRAEGLNNIAAVEQEDTKTKEETVRGLILNISM